jgi:hypothetical protein
MAYKDRKDIIQGDITKWIYAPAMKDAVCKNKKTINWYTEPINLMAEINKDGGYINSYLFKELGGVVPSNKSKVSIPFVPVLSFVAYSPNDDDLEDEKEKGTEGSINIQIAMDEGKMLIRKQKIGIPVNYNQTTNKANIDFKSLADALHYFEYELLGIWLFEKSYNGVFIGTKVEY